MVVMADTMAERTITIGKDYSRAPGGRFISHGSFSGEDFRERLLVPALKAGDHITVYLDDTAGYAGSFLEEAFGGLIRTSHFTPQDIANHLEVTARDNRYAVYVQMVKQYLKDAAAAAGKSRVA
jgi:hypothetical protein